MDTAGNRYSHNEFVNFHAGNSIAVNDTPFIGVTVLADVVGNTFEGVTTPLLGPGTEAGPNPAPEPATLALLGLALAGVGFTRRRKH